MRRPFLTGEDPVAVNFAAQGGGVVNPSSPATAVDSMSLPGSGATTQDGTPVVIDEGQFVDAPPILREGDTDPIAFDAADVTTPATRDLPTQQHAEYSVEPPAQQQYSPAQHTPPGLLKRRFLGIPGWVWIGGGIAFLIWSRRP